MAGRFSAVGVTSHVARLAATATHVLIVEVPGWGETRMLLEAELNRRGWTSALSPADADLLAICGIPGEELGAVCDRVWDQLPGPRTRVNITASARISASLDAAVADLVDDARQRHDAASRSRSSVPEDSPPDADVHADMDMTQGADEAGMDHEGMDHENMDHENMDHGGMDHENMEMLVHGIPLAGGGDDRDGLEMDVLTVPLGPVLSHWPAGLVVECVLQGDVIVSADVRILAAASAPTELKTPMAEAPRRRLIRLCDQAVQLLALAGWGSAARSACRLRDAAAGGVVIADQAGALDRLRRRVERSVVLRWSLKGLTVDVASEGTDALAVSGNEPSGDIRLRLIGWLREATDLADTGQFRVQPLTGAQEAQESQDRLAALPELLRGTDLATARLLVAGLGLDTAAVASYEVSPRHAGHGDEPHGRAGHGSEADDGVVHG